MEENKKTNGEKKEEKKNIFERGIDWICVKIEKPIHAIAENPGGVMMIGSLIMTIGGGILKLIAGAGDKETYLLRDEVTGAEYKLKHPMVNSEILELSDRMSLGQTKGDALNEMGVLANEKKRK